MCLRPVVECARKPSPVLARYPGPMSPPAAWDRGCFFQNATASTLPSTTKSTEGKARSESTMEGKAATEAKPTMEAKARSESTTEGEGARSESTMEAKATAEAKPTMETKAASTKATSTKAASAKAASAKATSAKAAPAKADCSKAVTARVRDTEGAPAGKGRRSQRRTGCRNRYGG